jgi:bifunctional DNase/RNase
VLSRQDGQLDTFPIWIGAAEGHAIKLALDTTLTPRPMSHDLIKSIAEHLNVHVRRIVIGDVKNSTYYATVYLENNGVERTVDARPSDAISLALRTNAPLYITEDVLARRNTANLDLWLAKQDKNSMNQQEVRES